MLGLQIPASVMICVITKNCQLCFDAWLHLRIPTSVMISARDLGLYVFRDIIDTLLQIVKKDHLLLETNQHKLITRLTPEEIEKMFGTPAGPNFEVCTL